MCSNYSRLTIMFIKLASWNCRQTCVSMVDFEQVNVIWLRAPNIRGGQNIVHENVCVTIILLEKKGNFILYLTLANWKVITQPVFTCSKSTIETLKQNMKYVQSYQ